MPRPAARLDQARSLSGGFMTFQLARRTRNVMLMMLA